MISTTTIEQIREIDILEIISKYVGSDLNIKGHRAITCCPLHEDKTPSFHVDTRNQFFKCFGCGKGGDGIRFVMEMEKCEFYDALRSIAQSFAVPIEYTDENPEQAADRELLFKINHKAAEIYGEQFNRLPEDHPARLHLEDRGYTQEEIVQWQIGYANDKKPLATLFREDEHYDAALELGLIKKMSSNKTLDVFFNRIIFPIHDHQGRVVGFTGRVIPGDEKKEIPKYINSKESVLYKKSNILYGLNYAVRKIKETKRCYLVEGQTDTVSFHKVGITNTVACSGTALSETLCKLLKKYTETVILAMDSDSAGYGAAMKVVNKLTREGLNTKIVELKISNGEKVKPADPDEFVRAMKDPISWLEKNEKDAVMWKADELITPTVDDPVEKNKALMEVSGMLACFPQSMRVARDEYTKMIREKFRVGKDAMDGLVNAAMEAFSNSQSRIDYKNRVEKNRLIELNGSPTTWPFVEEKFTKNGDFTGVEINLVKFIRLLSYFGYSRFQPDPNQESFTFIHLDKNVITNCNKESIFDHLEDFIFEEYDFEGAGLVEVDSETVINKLYKGHRSYFSKDLLNRVKQEKEVELNRDRADKIFFYYKNGFVEITKDGYRLKDYREMPGGVWKHQMLEREFRPIENFTHLQGRENTGMFADFVFRLSGEEDERFKALTTIIGYLLHDFYGYKLRAINLTDSRLTDVDDGRSGKTLLMKMLGRMRSYCEINGKDFNPRNEQKYTTADIGTQIVHINDVWSKFPIDSLFNDITEGYMVRKLFQQPFRIRSKFAVSSNRTLKIEGGSQRDRIIAIEVGEFFHENHSPLDEYGVWFPDNPQIDHHWNIHEWSRFDNFIACCCVNFLKAGIIIPSSIHLEERTLRDHTAGEFVDFMDGLLKESNSKEFDKKKLREDFMDRHQHAFSKRFEMTSRKFNTWLRMYSEKRLNIVKPRERDSNGVQWIAFKEDQI